MNVSERVSRIEGLMSQTIAQINREKGLTGILEVPFGLSSRLAPKSSRLFDSKGSASGCDKQGYEPA